MTAPYRTIPNQTPPHSTKLNNEYDTSHYPTTPHITSLHQTQPNLAGLHRTKQNKTIQNHETGNHLVTLKVPNSPLFLGLKSSIPTLSPPSSRNCRMMSWLPIKFSL